MEPIHASLLDLVAIPEAPKTHIQNVIFSYSRQHRDILLIFLCSFNSFVAVSAIFFVSYDLRFDAMTGQRIVGRTCERSSGSSVIPSLFGAFFITPFIVFLFIFGLVTFCK